MQKSTLQIFFFSLVVWLPNITWLVWIPLAAITSILFLNIRAKNQIYFFLIVVIYLLSILIYKQDLSSLRYAFFFICMYFLMMECPLCKRKNLNLFINLSLVLFVLSLWYFFAGMNFMPLNSREDYVVNNIFRIRLFFSEPAHLGLWCGFLAGLSIFQARYFSALIFIFGLIITASVGAMGFFTVFLFAFLIFGASRSLLSNLFITASIVAIALYFNIDQFQNKLSEDSLSVVRRVENLEIAWTYLTNNFGSLYGFGPILIENEYIGILNFNLLLFISLGFFIIFFIPFHKITFAVILPYLYISTFVGNFWETPMLLFLLNRSLFTYSKEYGLMRSKRFMEAK